MSDSEIVEADVTPATGFEFIPGSPPMFDGKPLHVGSAAEHMALLEGA